MNESAPQGEPIERDGFGPRTHLRWPPVEPMFQVAVAPHAAAGIGPTAMRPATAEEAAAWNRRAATQAAPSVAATDEQWTMDRAADFLEQYAAFIRREKPDDLEQHPYLPELEYVANQLRSPALPLPAVVQAGSHLDHQAADDRTQPAAPQLDTQRATEGMPAPACPRCHMPQSECDRQRDTPDPEPFL